MMLIKKYFQKVHEVKLFIMALIERVQGLSYNLKTCAFCVCPQSRSDSLAWLPICSQRGQLYPHLSRSTCFMHNAWYPRTVTMKYRTSSLESALFFVTSLRTTELALNMPAGCAAWCHTVHAACTGIHACFYTVGSQSSFILTKFMCAPQVQTLYRGIMHPET